MLPLVIINRSKPEFNLFALITSLSIFLISESVLFKSKSNTSKLFLNGLYVFVQEKVFYFQNE